MATGDLAYTSFNHQHPFPPDLRMQRDTINARDVISAPIRWEGMLVYVLENQKTYQLQGGLTNEYWVEFLGSGGGDISNAVLYTIQNLTPEQQLQARLNIGAGELLDGLISLGAVTSDVNDVTIASASARINGVIVGQNSPVTINVPPPTAGYTRRDLIVIGEDSIIYLVQGVEVLEGETAITPDVPVDTVVLVETFANDTGLQDFYDFAYSTFVRFDIDTQGLSPVQRQNARTNIQSVSRDTDDTKIGRLRFDTLSNERILDLMQATDSPIQIFTPEGVNRANLRAAQLTGLGNRALFELIGQGTGTRTLVTWKNSIDEYVFSILDSGVSEFSKHAPIHPDAVNTNQSATLGQVIGLIAGSEETAFTEMSGDDFFIGYRVEGAERIEVIFDKDDKDIIVTDVGNIILNPTQSVGNFIFTGNGDSAVTEIRGIEGAIDGREIHLTNRSGAVIPIIDSYVGGPANSAFGFAYNLADGETISIIGQDDVWEMNTLNQVGFSDNLDSVNAIRSIGPDGIDIITGIQDKNTGESVIFKKYPTTPSIVDGVIFAQLEDGYYKRKFTGPLNVEWYGTGGDGVTDDNLALQAAVSVLPGQVVSLEQGKIYRSTFGIEPAIGVSIEMNGSKILFDIASGTGGYCLKLDDYSGVKGGEIELLHGTPGITVASGEYLAGITIGRYAAPSKQNTNVTIVDMKIKTNVRGHGISSLGAKNCLFSNIEFDMGGYGLSAIQHHWSNTQSIVSEGVLHATERVYHPHNNIIKNIEAYNAGIDSVAVIYLSGCYSTEISNVNTLDGTFRLGIICSMGEFGIFATKDDEKKYIFSNNKISNCTLEVRDNAIGITSDSNPVYTGSNFTYGSVEVNNVVCNGGGAIVYFYGVGKTTIRNIEITSNADGIYGLSMQRECGEVNMSNVTISGTQRAGLFLDSEEDGVMMFNGDNITIFNTGHDTTQATFHQSNIVFNSGIAMAQLTNLKLGSGLDETALQNVRIISGKNISIDNVQIFGYSGTAAFVSSFNTMALAVTNRTIVRNVELMDSGLTKFSNQRSFLVDYRNDNAIFRFLRSTTKQNAAVVGTIVEYSDLNSHGVMGAILSDATAGTWTEYGINPSNASTSVAGLIEIATTTEQVAGSSTSLGSTPAGVNAQINRYGTTANLPDLSTMAIGAKYFDTTLGVPKFKIDNSTVYTAPRILYTSPTLDFGDILAGESETLITTVTGAALLDNAKATGPASIYSANATIDAWVSSTDTVSVRVRNFGGTTINPASGTFNIQVIKNL